MLFGRTLVLSCESYLEAGDDRAARCLQRMTRQHRHQRGSAAEASSDINVEMPELDELLNPAKRLHLEAYEEIAAAGSHTDFADLAQSPYYQTPCRKGVAPALLRGSQLFSLVRRRPLLPCELMVIQGIPAGSAASHGLWAQSYPFVSTMEEQWSWGIVRQLAGNSMHLCQVGSVISLLIALTAELARSSDDEGQSLQQRPAGNSAQRGGPGGHVQFGGS
jgi:hypothetical protein